MTLNDAITKFDTVCKNNIPADIKVNWISNFDSSVYKEIILAYDNSNSVSFQPYDDNTPDDTVLLIEDPYSDVYLKYLSIKKDLYYSDIARYNNDLVLFNEAYYNFKNYYNRTNKHSKIVEYFNA